jgi:hypothetical protein
VGASKFHQNWGDHPHLEDGVIKKLRLKTQAVCSWPRGEESLFLVELFWYEGWGIALQIVTTPGQWFLSQLLSGPPRERIAIDFGMGWYWENPAEVLEEAKRGGQFMTLSKEFGGEKDDAL